MIDTVRFFFRLTIYTVLGFGFGYLTGWLMDSPIWGIIGYLIWNSRASMVVYIITGVTPNEQ